MKCKKRILIPVLTSLWLGACGGGGSSAPTTPEPTPTPTPTPTPQPSTMDEQFGKYLTDLTNNHIVPGYTLLAENAVNFQTKAESFCAIGEPDNVALGLLKLSWLELNLQWQTMQWIKVGGAAKNNRALRLEFWPDTQNAVGKGVDALLATTQLVDAEYVASHNVGGQGIPALERLLFADNALLEGEDAAKRCEVTKAIAANLVNISEEIKLSWSAQGEDYATQLVEGTGNFSSRQDAVEELVTNWLEQLEHVKDKKLLIPLADTAPGLLQRSEFRFSDTSLAAIKINLQLFVDIYNAGGGHGFDDILINHLDHHAIETNLSETLSQVQAQVIALQGTLADVLADDPSREQVKQLIVAIQDFRTVMTADFVQALDINIGFNSNDGD